MGKYSPRGDSPYGVADMAGNVWEWCCNLYVPYPYHAVDGREDLEGTRERVVRGGAFGGIQWFARSACRRGYGPRYRAGNVGVRVGVAAAPFSPTSGL